MAELSQGERRLQEQPPHKINVQGHPLIKEKARRISPKLLTAAHAEVDRLLAEGIAELSESP